MVKGAEHRFRLVHSAVAPITLVSAAKHCPPVSARSRCSCHAHPQYGKHRPELSMRSLKINKIRDRPAQSTLNVSRVEMALADPRRVETRRYVSCSGRKGEMQLDWRVFVSSITECTYLYKELASNGLRSKEA